MTKLREAVNINLPDGVPDQITELADRLGKTRPEWCREVIDKAIDWNADIIDSMALKRRQVRFPSQMFVGLEAGRHKRISAMAAREGIPISEWLREVILSAFENAASATPSHQKESP